MSYPLIRFVDEPEPDALVRLDLNPTGYKDPGFSVGAPSFVGDVDAIDPELGFRQASFVFYVHDDKQLARAAQSQLARELMRERNWLLFQLSADSPPCWLHTYRSASVDVNFEHVHSETSEDFWQLPLTIEADPALIGEELFVDAITIDNDPSQTDFISGMSGCFVLLNDIKGDLPTPLRVDVHDPDSRFGTLVVSAVPDDVEYDVPLRLSINSFVSEPDNAGADISYSAPPDIMAGSVPVVSFATDTSLKTRLLATSASAVGPNDAARFVRGRFRVLMRMGDGMGAEGTRVIWVRLGQRNNSDNANPTYVWNDLVDFTIDSTDQRMWIDLGEISVPFGNPAPENDGHTYVPTNEISLALAIGRHSGAGDLVVDDAILLPVDLPDSLGNSFSIINFGAGPISIPDHLIVDGEHATMFMLNDPNVLPRLTVTPSLEGGWPLVFPGQLNVMHLLHARHTSNDRALTASTTVSMSYRPRWLFLPES